MQHEKIPEPGKDDVVYGREKATEIYYKLAEIVKKRGCLLKDVHLMIQNVAHVIDIGESDETILDMSQPVPGLGPEDLKRCGYVRQTEIE